METITKRRSRMSRDRRKANVQLTPRDIEIFKLLAKYRYLRSTFIHAVVGGYKTDFLWRMRKLFDDGYLKRPEQQWQFANSRYMPAIYELDARGEEVLASQGLLPMDLRPSRTSPHHHFPHDVMVSDILASIDIGVRADPTLSMISAAEILDRAPASTQGLNNPLAFLVDNTQVIPDGLFGIKTPRGVIFYAVEADRQNEPLRRTAYGSSYGRKFDMYKRLIKDGFYKTHLGTKVGLVVLHVTTNERHMANLMHLAGPAPYNLFKTMSTLGDFMKAPVPTPELLTVPWKRNGFPDFEIHK